MKSLWDICILFVIFFVNAELFQNKVYLEEKSLQFYLLIQEKFIESLLQIFF